MPDGYPWPKISIVTPSYQQAEFLEETIRSVLLQGYPNLEYIVIDGGSSDGSVEIIRRYEPWLAYWASERDRGQAHALNKGWAKCTGAIWAWLNSDDVYLPGTFAKVIPIFRQAPAVKLVYGSAIFTDQDGRTLNLYPGWPLAPGLERLKLWRGWFVPQPSAFFDGGLVQQYGPLNEGLRYTFDCEWFLRVAQREESRCIDETLATYRLHARSKTGVGYSNKILFDAEIRKVMRKFAPLRSPKSWPLYVAKIDEEFGPAMRTRYLRLHAFSRRIQGGIGRRFRNYRRRFRHSA